jgi:Holliday junction DNA helicase RuvA
VSGSLKGPSMIATLEGILEYRGADSVVLKVSGIGFEVHVPGSTLGQIGGPGDRVSLFTHLHMREDNVSLYGFGSEQELILFKDLISVSGVGPKVALAMLSSLPPEQMVMAITSGNAEVISQVPGIGKKTASRLIVELKGKLEKQWRESVLPLGVEDEDVMAALTSLGYSLKEASKAVSSLPVPSELSLEEKVKVALQHLATE